MWVRFDRNRDINGEQTIGLQILDDDEERVEELNFRFSKEQARALRYALYDFVEELSIFITEEKYQINTDGWN